MNDETKKRIMDELGKLDRMELIALKNQLGALSHTIKKEFNLGMLNTLLMVTIDSLTAKQAS